MHLIFKGENFYFVKKWLVYNICKQYTLDALTCSFDRVSCNPTWHQVYSLDHSSTNHRPTCVSTYCMYLGCFQHTFINNHITSFSQFKTFIQMDSLSVVTSATTLSFTTCTSLPSPSKCQLWTWNELRPAAGSTCDLSIMLLTALHCFLETESIVPPNTQSICAWNWPPTRINPPTAILSNLTHQ